MHSVGPYNERASLIPVWAVEEVPKLCKSRQTGPSQRRFSPNTPPCQKAVCCVWWCLSTDKHTVMISLKTLPTSGTTWLKTELESKMLSMFLHPSLYSPQKHLSTVKLSAFTMSYCIVSTNLETIATVFHFWLFLYSRELERLSSSSLRPLYQLIFPGARCFLCLA